MKLNADILFEQLSKYYPVKMYGNSSPRLLLSQPELYIDNMRHFYENHVYLATVEHLPHRPVIEKNVVLICIGDGPVLTYYQEHATLLLIRRKIDFYEVYQTVHHIFQIFAEWESRTLELFMGNPLVEDVLSCAYKVFERPLFVLDASFQYVAAVPQQSGSQFEEASAASHRNSKRVVSGIKPAYSNLDAEDFLAFLREKDMSMDIHGAFLLEMEKGSYLCVNLFNSSDEYVGCLYIDQMGQDHLPGENLLAEYLARMIEKVCEINPSLINHERSSLKDILQLTIREKPLARSQKLLLKTVNQKQNYYCISVHSLKPFSSLPVKYICSVFEGIIAGSIFFEYNNTLLGLIPSEILLEKENSQNLEIRLNDMISEMHLCIGVSNDFSDLYMLPTYYLQAEAAIENGHLYGFRQNIYKFSDFALLEMISNSLGGLPVEVYFPSGFRELISHDNNGGISYLETLRVFLEENMSYARAARRLYIHRSTLMERIERIEKELSIHLTDHDQRLQVQMILKALELEQIVRTRQT